MTTLTLSLLLQASILATDGQSYAEAHKSMVETGRPMVVLIGADWCPGCMQMKNAIIPQLKRNGSLDQVAYAYVNSDRQRTLSSKLMSGGSIPQLIIYRKTASGWTRQQLTGAHSIDATETFIQHQTKTEAGTQLTSR